MSHRFQPPPPLKFNDDINPPIYHNPANPTAQHHILSPSALNDQSYAYYESVRPAVNLNSATHSYHQTGSVPSQRSRFHFDHHVSIYPNELIAQFTTPIANYQISPRNQGVFTFAGYMPPPPVLPQGGFCRLIENPYNLSSEGSNSGMQSASYNVVQNPQPGLGFETLRKVTQPAQRRPPELRQPFGDQPREVADPKQFDLEIDQASSKRVDQLKEPSAERELNLESNSKSQSRALFELHLPSASQETIQPPPTPIQPPPTTTTPIQPFPVAPKKKRIRKKKPKSPSRKLLITETGEVIAPKVNSCRCKKSKCIRLYCECFLAKSYCGPACGCGDFGCMNKEDKKSFLEIMRLEATQKSPISFDPKCKVADISGHKQVLHTRGCRCKKKNCKSNYCECFKSGIGCTGICGCADCLNDKIDLDEREKEQHVKRAKRKRIGAEFLSDIYWRKERELNDSEMQEVLARHNRPRRVRIHVNKTDHSADPSRFEKPHPTQLAGMQTAPHRSQESAESSDRVNADRYFQTNSSVTEFQRTAPQQSITKVFSAQYPFK